MLAIARTNAGFKTAVFFSLAAHLILFLLVIFSPHLPKTRKKGMIHYVSLVSFPGGGGGPAGKGGTSGEEEKVAETPLPKRETLKDLTTSRKLEAETKSSLRHPVEKPKKELEPKKEKKAVIQKKTSRTPAESGPPQSLEKGEGKGPGTGSGVRIGGGGGPGSGLGGVGDGLGSAFSSQIGLSNFPYTYYLQIITARVSSNWFTSLVDPGIKGNFQTTVYFRIHKSGQVTDLKIQESSGIKSLDLSAMRAIQTSSPFPPLPRDYEDEYLGIYLIFEHTK